MSVAPVAARPAPLPEFPVVAPVFPDGASEDAAVAVVVEVVEVADVVEVVELVEVPPEEVVDVEADAADSPSNSVATFKSAVTMAGVGGADPRVSSSEAATGPTANRMYWANFWALAAGRPDVGTTR